LLGLRDGSLKFTNALRKGASLHKTYGSLKMRWTIPKEARPFVLRKVSFARFFTIAGILSVSLYMLVGGAGELELISLVLPALIGVGAGALVSRVTKFYWLVFETGKSVVNPTLEGFDSLTLELVVDGAKQDGLQTVAEASRKGPITLKDYITIGFMMVGLVFLFVTIVLPLLGVEIAIIPPGP